MTATESPRTRPQLNATITRLNEIIEGLSHAVPEVVADALQQSLGADFAAALGKAVAAALAPAVRDLVKAEVAAAISAAPPAPVAVTPPTPVPPMPAPQPVKPTLKARVLARLSRVRAWVGRQVDAATSAAAVGWALARLVAMAVAHSPAAVITAVLCGVGFGALAAVADPAVAVALTAVSVGTLTASAASAAPLVRAAFDPDQQ